jgi:hypothetical protein
LEKFKILRLANTQINDTLLSKWIDRTDNKSTSTCKRTDDDNNDDNNNGIVHLDIGQPLTDDDDDDGEKKKKKLTTMTSLFSDPLFKNIQCLRLDGLDMSDLDGSFLTPLTLLKQLVRYYGGRCRRYVYFLFLGYFA